MSKNARTVLNRGGFTLPEILVAVAMVGVLSAVTLPAVMSQVNKSEISKIVQDLQNIGTGLQLFRTDVGDWPASTDALITSAADGWKGPYLNRTGTGEIQTGTGAVILTTVSSALLSDSLFVELEVTSLSLADALAVDAQIDGDDAATWHDNGIVRGLTSQATTIKFYPVAKK